jgi:hypothetical protein
MAKKSIEIPAPSGDLRAGEKRQDEHLKRNPHGQMPALELDDGSNLLHKLFAASRKSAVAFAFRNRIEARSSEVGPLSDAGRICHRTPGFSLDDAILRD